MKKNIQPTTRNGVRWRIPEACGVVNENAKKRGECHFGDIANTTNAF